MQAVNERLRASRAALGLTQRELSEAAGVPLPSLKDHEAGKTMPGADALGGYMRAGISANWLVSGHQPMLLRDIGAVPAGALDPDHLKAVIVGLEQAIDEMDSEMAPERLADLVLALYELTRESGTKPQRATIIRLVRAAA